MKNNRIAKAILTATVFAAYLHSTLQDTSMMFINSAVLYVFIIHIHGGNAK